MKLKSAAAECINVAAVPLTIVSFLAEVPTVVTWIVLGTSEQNAPKGWVIDVVTRVPSRK